MIVKTLVINQCSWDVNVWPGVICCLWGNAWMQCGLIHGCHSYTTISIMLHVWRTTTASTMRSPIPVVMLAADLNQKPHNTSDCLYEVFSHLKGVDNFNSLLAGLVAGLMRDLVACTQVILLHGELCAGQWTLIQFGAFLTWVNSFQNKYSCFVCLCVCMIVYVGAHVVHACMNRLYMYLTNSILATLII